MSGHWRRDDVDDRCARERPLEDGDRLTEISLDQALSAASLFPVVAYNHVKGVTHAAAQMRPVARASR